MAHTGSFGMSTTDSPLMAIMPPCSGRVTVVLHVNSWPGRFSSTFTTSIRTTTSAFPITMNRQRESLERYHSKDNVTWKQFAQVTINMHRVLEVQCLFHIYSALQHSSKKGRNEPGHQYTMNNGTLKASRSSIIGI